MGYYVTTHTTLHNEVKWVLLLPLITTLNNERSETILASNGLEDERQYQLIFKFENILFYWRRAKYVAYATDAEKCLFLTPFILLSFLLSLSFWMLYCHSSAPI